MINQKKLLITKCSDPLMWYADKVGQTVPYLGEGYGYYSSREDAGWVNVVNMDDAVVVDDKNHSSLVVNKNTFYKSHLTTLPRCTRVEVIDDKGRSYVNWEEGNVVKFELQDDGKTLKVFINKNKSDNGGEGI